MGKVAKVIKKAVKKVVNTGVDLGKNVVNSPVNAVSSLAKGDVLGALTNVANVASMGTMDVTGKQQGIVNVDTKKYIAKAMGSDLGASGIGSVILPTSYKAGKSGLITQLRKGKGSVGGGSYSETAKNPLGGSSGKTGK